MDGKLQCLYCGGAYANLALHVIGRHGTPAQQYKEEFELPATFGLINRALKEMRAANARRTAEADPRFRGDRNTPQQLRDRSKLAARARVATNGRAGVQASRAQAGARVGKASARAAVRKYDERAQKLGYADLDDLLANTTDLTSSQIAQTLGVPKGNVEAMRRHRLVRSTRIDIERAARRKALDQAARRNGYPDVAGLVAGTWHLSRAEVAALLGVTVYALKNLYRMFDDLPRRPPNR